MFQTILRRYLVAQSLKLHNAVTLLQKRNIYVTPGDFTFAVIPLDFKQLQDNMSMISRSKTRRI